MSLRKWQDLDLERDCPTTATGEVSLRRPSPHPAPRPTPRRPMTSMTATPIPPAGTVAEAAGFPLAVIERDPILAGGIVWETADADTSPIGWALAQECGVRIGGYWVALWALTQHRDALAAEMATL